MTLNIVYRVKTIKYPELNPSLTKCQYPEKGSHFEYAFYMCCFEGRHFSHDETLLIEHTSLLKVNATSGHDTPQYKYIFPELIVILFHNC